MKKIAFLIDDITHGGGTERVTVQLAKAFTPKYEVTILSIKTSEKEKFDINNDVKIISFHGEAISNKWKQRIHTGKCINKLCQQKKIDVLIVVETYKFLNLLPVMKQIKETGVRIITWEHFNYYVDKKYSVKWWARYFSARYSDALIVLGKEDLKNYKKNLKNIKKIEYIYNPVVFDVMERSWEAEKIVLAVGRLEEQKGFDYLLNIWKKVEESNRFQSWKLQIIGSGTKEEELKRQADNLKLKNVEMLPFQENIHEFYKKSSIFALTSRYEGFGLVLLEAQAYGLPVVSFDIKEGPKEIIDDGVNGYLIKKFDEEMFAERLCLLMSDEKIRKKMSRNAGKDLGRFQMETIVQKWDNLIEEL